MHVSRASIRGVGHRPLLRDMQISCLKFRGVTLLETNHPRKHALECLRLQAECLQLAVEFDRQDARVHFVRMAGVWAALAEGNPVDTDATQTLETVARYAGLCRHA
jgi:hypothetical protein